MSKWYWEVSDERALFPPTVTSFVDGWRPWYGPLEDGPPVTAEVFAREFIQNFADAADELEREVAHGNVPGIEFRFIRLTGDEASRVTAALGLTDHVERYQAMSATEKNDHRLDQSDLLAGSGSDLRLLVARERYATGMYGPWVADGYARTEDDKPIRRKMRDALIKPSGDKGSAVALGSYGEGKKGVILSSRMRTLLAYSCSAPRPDEPEGEVTRRLLGVTYWRRRIEGRRDLTGLGLLADDSGSGRPVPLVDSDADSVVNDLDLESVAVRDPASVYDLGTTWLFVEPSFGAADLAWAVSRNWWPRLQQGSIAIDVFDEEHQQHSVDPADAKSLAPFLDAADLLHGKRQAKAPKDLLEDVRVGSDDVGRLAVTTEPEDQSTWAWEDADENAHIVALIRAGMVIQYMTVPRKRPRSIPPFVRGVFEVGGGRAPAVLRLAEPPLHNYWETNPSTGYPRDSVRLADQTYSRILKMTGEFAKRFRDEPPPQKYRFDVFAQFFQSGDSPIVPPPPPPPPPPLSDPWEIRRPGEEQLVSDPDDPARIGVVAEREVALKDSWRDDELEVLVRLRWRVLEDGDSGVEEPGLIDLSSDVVPKGFVETDHGYRGVLTKDAVTFSWSSAYFEGDWLTKASFEIESVSEEAADG